MSRTVVREAIAALRSDGLVEPRQGAGVFLLEQATPARRPFQNVDLARVSSLIEMLELRTAVEGDAAAFAALRCSPGQEGKIIEAFDSFRSCAAAGNPTAEADFAFHVAIAEATNNPRFREFLDMLGPALIPRRAIVDGGKEAVLPTEEPAASSTNTRPFSSQFRTAMKTQRVRPCVIISRRARHATAPCCALRTEDANPRPPLQSNR